MPSRGRGQAPPPQVFLTFIHFSMPLGLCGSPCFADLCPGHGRLQLRACEDLAIIVRAKRTAGPVEVTVRLVKLEPRFHPRPWGRPSLDPLYQLPAPSAVPIGEVWLTSLESRVSGEGLSSRESTLGKLWERMPPEERGAALAGLDHFPLLVKFVFTADKLSIQVHPDDAYARRHAGEPWGKSELWYVVTAEPGAWVQVGLKAGMTREQLQQLCRTPAVEAALHTVPVKAGDAVYLPAGTLHSIGPGLCLCEVQQYSDLTFRVYDYDRPGLDGRPRTLHLEEALAVTRLQTPEAGLVQPAALDSSGAGGQRLLACPYFVVEKYQPAKALEVRLAPAHFDLLVFLSGAGQMQAGANRMDFSSGDAFLVTADEETVRIEPRRPTELLRAYPRPVREPSASA